MLKFYKGGQLNMMISPETYYEEYLKGKTKEQILSAIRGLKREIGRLKNTLENESLREQQIATPSAETRIQCTREYLQRAKLAYSEAGGQYKLSKSEETAAEFEANLNAISKITLDIGGYFGGYCTYIVEMTDELSAHKILWEDKEAFDLINMNKDKPFTKSDYLLALSELHIGEWRRRYSTERFGYYVLDGTHWSLEFEYNNGHKPISFSGDNSYPYNFEKLKLLFGIEESVEDEDTEDEEE